MTKIAPVFKGVVLLAAAGFDAYQKNVRATKARQSVQALCFEP